MAILVITLAMIPAKIHQQVPHVLLVIIHVRGHAIQHVQQLVKEHLQVEDVQIVQTIALPAAPKLVQMLAKPRHHRDALIVQRNVVEIVSMNAPMVVGASVTHRVAVNAKENAEVLVRWNAFRTQRTPLVLHAEEHAEAHVTRIVHTTAIQLVKA